MIMYQHQYVVQSDYWISEQLEHVLEKSSAIRWQMRLDNNGVRREMTSIFLEVAWKMKNLMPPQFEIKTILKEPSSTGS